MNRELSSFFSLIRMISRITFFSMESVFSVMKSGDLVKFCKNPPEDMDHCNIWEFGVGVILSIDLEKDTCKILCEGTEYSVGSEWIGDLSCPFPPRLDYENEDR